MKWVICFFLIIVNTCGFAKGSDAFLFMELVEMGDVTQIQKILEYTSNSNMNQIQDFLKDLTQIIESKFNMNVSFEEIKEQISIILSYQNLHQNTENQFEDFFNEIEIEQLSISENSPGQIFCKKKKKSHSNKSEQESIEFPAGVVVGGLEALCGALLWITPFRTIGTGLIVDGVRRMLNEAQEKEKEVQQRPQTPYYDEE